MVGIGERTGQIRAEGAEESLKAVSKAELEKTNGQSREMEFGEKVKQIREEHGMTQQTLAEKLYVTRQAVSRWECGARHPDLLTAKKIARILDVSLDELLSGEALRENIEREPVLEKPVENIVQTALYAGAAVIYLLLCLFSLYELVVARSHDCLSSACLYTQVYKIYRSWFCGDHCAYGGEDRYVRPPGISGLCLEPENAGGNKLCRAIIKEAGLVTPRPVFCQSGFPGAAASSGRR